MPVTPAGHCEGRYRARTAPYRLVSIPLLLPLTSCPRASLLCDSLPDHPWPPPPSSAKGVGRRRHTYGRTPPAPKGRAASPPPTTAPEAGLRLPRFRYNKSAIHRGSQLLRPSSPLKKGRRNEATQRPHTRWSAPWYPLAMDSDARRLICCPAVTLLSWLTPTSAWQRRPPSSPGAPTFAFHTLPR